MNCRSALLKGKHLIGFLFVGLLLSGVFHPITPALGAGRGGKLTVYVVNYPLKYFAERIAGDHAKVEFPVPAGVDPSDWKPDSKAILEYQKADLILINGANYAKWVGKATLPTFRIVDTSASFTDRYVKAPGAVTHTHGPGGKHAHEGIAFTTWLDFELASRQAGAVEGALSRRRPDLKEIFEKNFNELEKELLPLDREVKGIVASKPGLSLIGSHPVYQYLSKRYGLNMISVHFEPGDVPTVEQWVELKKTHKVHPARWMIWEGQPAAATAGKLKEMGIGSIVFDPCANTPADGDFLSVMKGNLENLKKAFR